FGGVQLTDARFLQRLREPSAPRERGALELVGAFLSAPMGCMSSGDESAAAVARAAVPAAPPARSRGAEAAPMVAEAPAAPSGDESAAAVAREAVPAAPPAPSRGAEAAPMVAQMPAEPSDEDAPAGYGQAAVEEESAKAEPPPEPSAGRRVAPQRAKSATVQL